MLRSTARLAVLTTLALLGACTCRSEVAPAKAAPVAKAAAKAAAPEAPPPAKTAPPVTPPAEASPPLQAPPPADPADAADPLGKRFIDPTWFRKEMFDGAKAMDVSRSERNEKGLFSSQILFELPAGTTAEQCADQIEAKVKGDVPNLTRAPDAKSPGRLKLTGDTQRYRVTMMCGEAKGVMRAYVGYEWLE